MSLGLLAALAVLLANLHVRGWLLSQSSEGGKLPVVGATPNASENGAKHVDRAHFAWLPATIVFALAAIGVAAILLAERRRRARADARKTVGEAIADVLAETLDDLLAEADPRRAVIAAYARLVRILAARGLPRRAPETPGEYLARILGRLDVDTRSVQRLTDLFTRAEFSQHAVDEAMKKEAIGALARVCDELRAAQAGSGQVPTEGLQVSAGSA